MIVPSALGPIQYGHFSFLQQFYTQIIGFLDTGTSIAFFTKLSANQKRKELITFYMFYILVVSFLIVLFIYSINTLKYTDTLFPGIPNNYIYMGLSFGILTWITQMFIKISDANALTVSVEWLKIIHKILSLCLLLYFVSYTAFDLTHYFYFHYISMVAFITIVGLLFVKSNIFNRHLLTLRFGFKQIGREFFHFSSPLVVYSTVGLGVGFLDIWLLQKMGGSIQSGFYGLAYSIVAASFLFTSAMTPIITREFSKSYEEKNIEQMRNNFYRYIPMLYSIAAFFGIFLSFQSENILAIFTDGKFKDAYWVLVIMAFYPLHQTYGQLSGSIFYATGQTKLYRNIGIFSMLFGLLFTGLFIYFLNLGAIGLALKMVIIQFIVTNIQLYFNAKFLDFKMKPFVWHQVYSIGFFIVMAYIATHISTVSDNIYIRLCTSSLVYIFLVTIAAYIFPKVFATNRNEIKLVTIRLIGVFKK